MHGSRVTGWANRSTLVPLVTDAWVRPLSLVPARSGRMHVSRRTPELGSNLAVRSGSYVFGTHGALTSAIARAPLSGAIERAAERRGDARLSRTTLLDFGTYCACRPSPGAPGLDSTRVYSGPLPRAVRAGASCLNDTKCNLGTHYSPPRQTACSRGSLPPCSLA